MSRDGYRGDGAFGQLCMVYPEHDLVVSVTAGDGPDGATTGAVRDCLLPGVDDPDDAEQDEILADRLRHLSCPLVSGSGTPRRSVTARLDASAPDSPLPDGSAVIVAPTTGGWLLELGPILGIEVGFGVWRESSPLGRPIVAAGAWQDNVFVAELFVITSAHRVRLKVDGDTGVATATWSTVPLTGPSLALHVQAPLKTRPDVA